MLTVQLVAKILQTVMALDDTQIWVYNQRHAIPGTKGLFVVVGMVDATPYGNNMRNSGTASETRFCHLKETISIDLLSYDLTAPTRLPELLTALRSTYAEQIQEQYGFKLAPMPLSVNNTSEAEGSAMIHRFTVTTVAHRAYDSTSTIDYFDTFASPETFTEQGEVG